MRIIDIPEFHSRKEVLIFDKNMSVFDAVQKMASLNYGSAIIGEQGKLLGIFTERDLLNRVVSQNLDAKNTPLIQVMTHNPQTANNQDDVIDSLNRMSSGRFRHLPIVDSENNVKGLVSQGDFIAVTWGQLLHRLTQQTKFSFLKNTTLWMAVISIAVYTVLIIWAIKIV